MAIFLDSARADEARKAFSLGFVGGITTNPKLLSQAGGNPEDIIRELCAISTGPVCYQLTAATVREREEEALRVRGIAPGKLVMKIACTTENLALLARLTSEHRVVCAATAVFGGGQAYIACEAGARYLIPYVNRITAGGGDGPGLVRDIAAVAASVGKGAEVLAASLKTPEEVARTVLAGARHVTLPLVLIEALGNDPRSDEAIRMFAECTGK
jgi:transaldolase